METDKNAKNRVIFEEMPVPRALFTLAVPTVIGQLVILAYNLADTFFIGRVNNPYMVGGVSLILPVFNICISIANLAGVGGGSLISRLLGMHRDADARKVSVFSFWLAFVLSSLFALLTLLFLTPFLHLLGASGETFIYAKQYTFFVIVLGALPTVLSITMANLLRSVGLASKAGFGISMGGIINIALDPLFMFVIMPRGYEICGVGIATFCSNLITCSYFFLTIFRVRNSTILTFAPREGLPARSDVASVFTVGIPAALAMLLFDLDYIVIDRLAAGYSDIALAAVGIVLKAERLPLNIGVGLAQGMMPLAAYNYASGNRARMRSALNFTRVVGLLIAGLSVLLYLLLAPQIMRIFIADPETVAIGTRFLRIRCLATPFMFLSFIPVNFFQAVGHGGTALFLAVARWAVFNIPMLFLLNALFGMYGIVWSQLCGDVLTVLVCTWVLHRFHRREKAAPLPGPEEQPTL